MKFSSSIGLTIAGIIWGTLSFSSSLTVAATTFSEQELDPNSVIAVARPYGNGNYDLLVIEQLPGQRQCWDEIGSKPTTVEPLLLNFDFTGSCKRSTDSNGYSLRINGEDLGLDYLLRIVERDGELWLIGSPRRDHSQPELVLGRTYGLKQGMLKIFLNPSWRMSQRSFGRTLLTHFYFSTQNNNPKISSQPLTPVNSYNTTNPSSNNFLRNTPPVVKEWKFTAQSPTNANYPPSKPPREIPLPVSTPSSSATVLPPVENKGRKNLSEILPLPTTSVASLSPATQPPTNHSIFRVIAFTKNSQDQQKVIQIYPDAFPTSYQGVSVIQIGRFGNRSNAQLILETLKNAGLEGRIVQ